MQKKSPIKPVFETIKKKVDAYKNRNTTVRPAVVEKLNSLSKRFISPKAYFTSNIQRMASEFYDFNNALVSKELPLNPKDIKLDSKDPLYKEKSRFAAIQTANRLTSRITPRKVGNIFEIKLTLILRNKKLSSAEKQQQLNNLIKEIDSFQKISQVDKRIKSLESEISKNVDTVTNILKDINSFLESNSVNPVEKKELLNFLELWKRNLRNSDAILREYKVKRENLRALRAKINDSITKL
ncbi:MAG: hypothetical protein WCX82_00120 [archaeon]|jgi:hypothetical protein